ncbi:hypothetical protein QWY20_15505 [Alkalimonas sp. MEB108]|uniref:Uncharacterized protein n=1 Tax=Alkalimonas cellulosilytica TaxID=3058395 RepID=A0ABU7J8I8_9GAMM|nr:hypothetical protein [Alkalimonas sp. MEB108]MEE2002866.1 hypothetical protein [Alkalimonas sp. MEB108]
MRYVSIFICCSLFMLISCGGSESTQSLPPPVSTPIPEPEPAPFSVQLSGLHGLIVGELQLSEQYLFALTNAGLFRADLHTLEWQSLGFDDAHVLSLARIADHHMLAGVQQQDDEGYHTFSLYETTDAGHSWLEIKHNFGHYETENEQGKEQIFRTEPPFALIYEPDNATLYGSGYDVLAHSTDYGLSWQVLHGGWGMFSQPNTALAINPDKTEVWSGGQGLQENPLLYQFNLHTSELIEHHAAMREVLSHEGIPGPAVVYAIRFFADQPERTFVMGEGGIAFSDDQGGSWHSMIGDVNYRFYYDLLQDPTTSRLYTAGWSKEFDLPQPLIIEWSDDAGQSWQRYQYPSNSLFGGVRSMVMHQQQGELTLFFGLYKGGVIQVKPTQP